MIACIDHLGNKYRSIREMTSCYKISDDTFKHRIKVGMSLKDALTKTSYEVRSARHGCINKKEIADPFGNKFNAVQDMCKHYNISHSLYCHRIARGWSQDKALTTPPRKKKR